MEGFESESFLIALQYSQKRMKDTIKSVYGTKDGVALASPAAESRLTRP